MESKLADYLKECSLVNHGLTPKDTRELVYTFAVGNSLKTTDNWISYGTASKNGLLDL